MDWTKAGTLEQGVTIPDNWLLLHYYEALNVLFRVENALRMLVYVVLKNELGEKWHSTTIGSDDGGQTSIASLAKKRIAQNEVYGYLTYPINSPLLHLTSGELVRLITSGALWSHFKPYFPGAKEVVLLKLHEIGIVRNALAHFRPIRTDDIEVVKQNAKQVLSEVERTLVQILNCRERVPTNTTEAWYTGLSTLGGDKSKLLFTQSKDREWVRVTLQYDCPILSKIPYSDASHAYYDVLDISTTEILRRSGMIRSRVIFIIEGVHSTMRRGADARFVKNLRFTFSRKTLAVLHDEIRSELDGLLVDVAREVGLIQEDHLARGDVVRVCRVSAEKKSYGWSFDERKLESPVQLSDPVEYWGSILSAEEDYISHTARFPWMPVDVSRDVFPF